MNPNQRTPEWYRERMGKITCSRMGDVLRMSVPYMEQIRAELRGEITPETDSVSLRWGRTYEPQAIAAYELATDRDVILDGFTVHPTIPYIGGSVDGLVGEDGLIEVKCPHSQMVHEVTKRTSAPQEHMPQIQGLIWVTERSWCDFVSFDSRLDPPDDLYIERIMRDDLMIAKLRRACARFWKIVNGEDREAIPRLF